MIEQDTGQKWLNGKSIFKKTIDFGVLPNSTEKAIAHGVTGLDKLVALETNMRHASGTQRIDFTYVTGFALRGVTATTVNIQSNLDLTQYTDCYFTIYYTKN